MATDTAAGATGGLGLIKQLGKKLFDALMSRPRSDSPKPVGMFAGSLVSQDTWSPGKPRA